MKLTLTHYIDTDKSQATRRLDAALARALDSATLRVAGRRDDTVTTSLDDGVRILRGLDVLEGSELHLDGVEHLTEIRIEVPWAPSDSGTTKLWAANRFAGVVADELSAA